MLSYKTLITLTKPIFQPSLYRAFSSSSKQRFDLSNFKVPQYQNIIYEQKDKVGLITLNRPKALNALCDSLIRELNDLLAKLDDDKNIGAIVITGSEKAFAAGADIKEMKDRTYPDTYNTQMLAHWDYITNIKYFFF